MMNTYGANKPDYFLQIYEQHFHPKKNCQAVLEIGVRRGGSLKLWRDYFPNALITGVDIDSRALNFQEEQIKILIGDQSDKDFLNSLGSYDIIIDDGGHTMKQQITTFKNLFPKLANDGIYVIEDLETSYFPKFGSDSGENTVEFLKGLIDDLQEYAQNDVRFDERLKLKNSYNIKALHIYPALAIIHKK